MSGIWRQKMNLDISSQDLQDFILMVLSLMKNMSTHHWRRRVMQIQKLGVKLMWGVRISVGEKTVWCPVYPVYCFDPDFWSHGGVIAPVWGTLHRTARSDCNRLFFLSTFVRPNSTINSNGLRSLVTWFLLLGLPPLWVLCFGGVFLCLDFGPFFFSSLLPLPCRVVFPLFICL